ncbi:MAG TPA: methionyl-tRNA formyltransferase [Candidatus Limnocylindria bacterium]|nr:methionyl-tRNA formyltransferase [Candidatus Limnocylindria bacterium]
MTAGAAPVRASGPARTVFFGSGAFAVPILEALLDHPRIEVVGIVTAPDRPAGRGRTLLPTPVALKARSMWVPLLQPARVRAPEAIAEIAALQPELGVLADYGQIVPEELLALSPRGILNVHPSLLPRHRGATPVPAAIAAGDEETGVSLIRMDAGVDTGPIVAASAWPLDGTERTPELETRAAREGAALLAASIDGWLDGSLRAEPQPEGGATLTRTFRKSDGRLNPSLPAAELERKVRAHAPWPGTFVETEQGRVAILAASTAATAPEDEPGQLVEHDERLAMATADGRLVLEQAQREGRRPTDGREFLRGQRALVGTRVGAPAGKVAATSESAETTEAVAS